MRPSSEYWQQQIDSGESAILSQYSDQYFSWECFKQIFDSYKENEEIVKIAFGEEKVDQYAGAATTMEVDATVLDKIGMLLPYTTPLAIETEQTLWLMQNAEAMTIVNGFDVDKGTLYARKYATSPNTGSYYFFSNGDCTNFVSQILENGGVAQQVYASISQGWWHIVTNKKHTHSTSWTSASTFPRYMGRGYSTKDFRAFSYKVQEGDFIAKDSTGKGTYRHMGYVSRLSDNTHEFTKNGVQSRNFQVAQHTDNYNSWCNGTVNNWSAGSGTSLYCIVRRAVS